MLLLDTSLVNAELSVTVLKGETLEFVSTYVAGLLMGIVTPLYLNSPSRCDLEFPLLLKCIQGFEGSMRRVKFKGQ